jgi:NAD(P)-dependent dehydrogenase (short-subunit alcohol dehydrogenase family)
VRAERELRATLARLRECGGEVMYRAIDVCDAAAVRRAVDAGRARFGRVRGIVHGAGVIADRLIEDKTDEQFRRVFDTKVEGLLSLLRACDGDAPRFLAIFSSSTARFGRRGQADYAAANETLNKLAWQQARRWPGCRVASLNWGPWDGGMVTPDLAALFAREGVGLIPVDAGAVQHLREVSASPGDPVEIVLLGGHGAARRGIRADGSDAAAKASR